MEQTNVPAASEEARLGTRILGIDVARGLALVGMFVAHAAPKNDIGFWEMLAVEVSSERSRLLFAVTAGLGLGLLTGGIRIPPRTKRWMLRGQIAVRAFFLLVLGLLLTSLGPLLFVILDEYGIAFALMIPLVFLPAPWLLGAGLALLAVMPGITVALAALPHVGAAASGPWAPFLDWFVTGSYPVVIWVPILMIGVAVVRLDLRRPRVVLVAGVLAVVIAVGGLIAGTALTSEEMSYFSSGQPPPFEQVTAASLMVVGNVGVCLAVTMGLIALTMFTPGRVRRASAIVLTPLAAAGSMPLTVYTVQVLVLWASIRTENGIRTDDSWLMVGALTVGSLLLAWLWRRYIGRGPLEWIIGVASGRVSLEARRRG